MRSSGGLKSSSSVFRFRLAALLGSFGSCVRASSCCPEERRTSNVNARFCWDDTRW